MRKQYSDGICIKNKRPVNMDGLLLCERKINGCHVRFAAVCDGVGSTANGAYAAGETLNRLKQWFDGLQDTEAMGSRLLNRLEDINIQLSAEIEWNNLVAATTCSALLMTESSYFIVHTGDSRIYAWTDGRLELLTKDMVSDTGKLVSYIGNVNSADFEYREGNNTPEFFLLCSDGLYKRMDLNFLYPWMKKVTPKNIKKIEQELVDFVVARGEQDNISIAIIFNKGWEKR